ncbi:tetratricopeptide repeat protein [Streptomyces qinglanensis]|uniref:Tetratricopeptide repeat-containing protein n=1 Tax=Streptomyces qinglanensis TaxID=943816 RepID=A0A1H9UQX3_9ACTN|nr:tetratricopeptide repeat protein [Streptomyces qinglanensis]SES11792.1 Tetratricopeptide repeat-containing protein [Streptomyces qinglanensis]
MRIFGKVRHRPSASWRQATDRAFTLIGDGRYEDAGALLTRAADLEPWLSESWFNLALLYKFRHDWEQARTAGLRAVALLDRESGAPDWWNVGIAATALQDWPLARRAWQAYGLHVPGPSHGAAAAEEPTGMQLGSAAVRLSPEGEAEVVWGRRIDPARMEIQSIPLPSSGRRWGEVVLHDGVPHGERTTAAGPSYPVFDEIELWAPSPVPTWVVLLEAATESDRDALERLAADAGFAAEDWSSSVRLLCRACSESAMPADEGDGTVHLDPHDHSSPGHPGPLGHMTQGGPGELWVPERECGLAAPAALVHGLLDGWVADSPDTREWRDLEEVC